MADVYVVGKVVHGFAEGRGLGYPTANLELAVGSFRPPAGVYAVCVEGVLQKSCAGLLVSGVHWETEQTPRLEVHLIDYNADLYGKKLQLTVVKRLRDVVVGLPEDQLIQLIQQDIAQAKDILRTVCGGAG